MPSGLSTIITSRKNPKMPNEIEVTSNPSGPDSLFICGSPKRFIIDSAIAPTITPQMLPMPPTMIIARMNTEKPNSNWSTFTVLL
jgi:hypothetical protein